MAGFLGIRYCNEGAPEVLPQVSRGPPIPGFWVSQADRVKQQKPIRERSTRQDTASEIDGSHLKPSASPLRHPDRQRNLIAASANGFALLVSSSPSASPSRASSSAVGYRRRFVRRNSIPSAGLSTRSPRRTAKV